MKSPTAVFWSRKQVFVFFRAECVWAQVDDSLISGNLLEPVEEGPSDEVVWSVDFMGDGWWVY